MSLETPLYPIVVSVAELLTSDGSRGCASVRGMTAVGCLWIRARITAAGGVI